VRALFFVGLTCFLFMFFGAKFLTTSIMGNPGAYCATLVLSPSLLFLCCVSALRGYAQGQSVMAPTAISQIIEALSKLLLGLFLAKLLLQYGSSMTDAFTPE
jgi:stage V sporulation protein B